MKRPRTKQELAELVQGAIEAQEAGVVLRLKDWNGFDLEEKSAWLAAKRIRAKPAPAAAEPDEEPVDEELRAALERGCDLVEARRES